ncbi:hypothetical protein Pcinc_023024 [Petrolisthes cinctipes]|uniref:Uncharacterized protein n=1 Tax=Petrolisthes cinctipes TaxID=88211 RepID=A0AAE1KCT5_PETCI|nr:hypothetical protein Pcinc_023024 [Petrolisthes cinctipes]
MTEIRAKLPRERGGDGGSGMRPSPGQASATITTTTTSYQTLLIRPHLANYKHVHDNNTFDYVNEKAFICISGSAIPTQQQHCLSYATTTMKAFTAMSFTLVIILKGP